MPIASNTFQQTLQLDGRISYVLRLYDQDGKETTLVGFLPPATNTQTFITAKIAEVNTQLAEEEFRTIIGT